MRTRYFVGFLATIGLIILAFVLIFNLTGSDSDNTGSPEQTELTSYAASTKTVRYTLDGRITAESTHRQVQVSVGQNRTTISIIGGYQGNVIESKSYDNNQSSYRTFLAALQRAGFTEGDEDADVGDARGACPTGRRFLIEAWDGDSRLQHLWTTNCKGGNFKGNLDQIQTLFERQIPDYHQIVNKYDL